MNIIRIFNLPVIVGLICFLLAGCSGAYLHGEETLLDKNWGRSYETAKFNQTLDPDAPLRNDPVTGMSGGTAENAIEQYQNSFKEQKQEEVGNILKLQ